ncbi:MAG: FeoA family protein [Chitinivibrionales bacterium]
MKLTDCREGQTVVVKRIEGNGPIRKRLLEMGFTRGTPVKIVKYAPLRDPLELVVKQFHVSLRIREACLLHVEATEETQHPI